MTRPLDGITVVSLEHAIAAPFCTRQLADLGARVIKVERPGAGDFARAYDERVGGEASHFVWVNRSKESITLDLKQPAALEVLRQLLAEADVLVQNLAPGAAQRMGLGAQALQAEHPRLIVCDATRKALASKDLRDKLDQQGVEIAPDTSPEQFAKLLQDDLAKWARIVKASGAAVD